jgi:hypothetical protein
MPHALHELEHIVDAVEASTESIRAALGTLGVEVGETTPDTFPEEWREDGDLA